MIFGRLITMSSWLIMYLIGVVLGLCLVLVANRSILTKVGTWKWRATVTTLLYTLGSWIFIFIVALRGIIENS